MLDALLPALETVRKLQSAPVGDVWSATCKAAREGADLTLSMNAMAGRSSYVPTEALKSVPDPSAMAVAFWLTAVKDAIVKV